MQRYCVYNDKTKEWDVISANNMEWYKEGANGVIG